MDILQQAARGLNAAHKLGIIHRDLKPDNIFLTRSDDDVAVAPVSSPAEARPLVKIVDFGIAKLRESATHTLTGTVLGTPAYMSYEQASGMKSEELDARSDVYSLGIVAYEMLTGRVPFHSDTPLGCVRKHLSEAPPPFRAVKPELAASPELEKVVMKALAKDRERRFASVMEFALALSEAANYLQRAASDEHMPSTKIVRPAVGAVHEPPPTPPSVPGSAAHDLSVALTPEPSHSNKIQTVVGSRRGLWIGVFAVVVAIVLTVWYFSSPRAARKPSTEVIEHLGRGVALGNQKNWDSAIAEFREAIQLKPDDPNAHFNLGVVLGKKGDWDGAVAEYREAIRLKPDDAQSHEALGFALSHKGDIDGAIEEFREETRLKPDDAVVHTLLGLELEIKGDRRAALDEYRKAYELDPKNSKIRGNYEKLLKQLHK